MAEIITNRELRHEIEQLIRNAETFLYVISPYMDFDNDLKLAFQAVNKDVTKAVFYRTPGEDGYKNSINEDTRKFLRSLPNIELFNVNNLHAKLFITDGLAIVSTMNLTHSSNHNHEIGVLIEEEEDVEMYEDCCVYIFQKLFTRKDGNVDWERLKNIIPEQSFRIEIYRSKPKINGEIVDKERIVELQKTCNVKHGFCIRCGSDQIEFNPMRPMCHSCYSEWRKYGNYNYEEKYCHRCFIEEKTTIDESMCGNCFFSYELEIERVWRKT
ncbi:phospholipase D family protein [Robiginitalea biformata]|uniref:phospholipase D family protein n=1 Tax=Robiginitalea biformata TaxID=252307 RepID=UPI003B5A9923